MKIIDSDDFQNVQDRTLLIGKTKNGAIRHIYMKNGEINIIEYQKEAIYTNNPVEPKGYADRLIAKVGPDALTSNSQYLPKGVIYENTICPEFLKVLGKNGLSIERFADIREANLPKNNKSKIIGKTKEEIESKNPERVLAREFAKESLCKQYAGSKFTDVKDLSFSLHNFVINNGIMGYESIKSNKLVDKQFESLKEAASSVYPEVSSLSNEDFFDLCQGTKFYEEVESYLDTISRIIDKTLENSDPSLVKEMIGSYESKHKEAVVKSVLGDRGNTSRYQI